MKWELVCLARAIAAKRFELMAQENQEAAINDLLFRVELTKAFQEIKTIVTLRTVMSAYPEPISKIDVASRLIHLAHWTRDSLERAVKLSNHVTSPPEDAMSIIDAARVLADRKCQETGI